MFGTKKSLEKKSKKMISFTHYGAASKSASDCHQLMPSNRHFVLNFILFILILFYLFIYQGKVLRSVTVYLNNC